MAHEQPYPKEAKKTTLRHHLPHRLSQPLKPNLCMMGSSQARKRNGFLMGTVFIQHLGGQHQKSPLLKVHRINRLRICMHQYAEDIEVCRANLFFRPLVGFCIPGIGIAYPEFNI